ncbi:MAG: hypothetical protein JW814_11070 [Candidatus Krumholzibacteriota bacterium]|nr:hypothetical protein [Candidatus Krumholzibacteriota bacterium]
MSKFFSSVLILALITGVFAGCGGSLDETYQMVTIREAGHANITSPGFKFGFDTPKFIAVNGNVGLVRDGNLIEFFTGEDLENKVKLVEGRKFVAGTRKVFSPRVHFAIDFFVVGGDTIKVGEPYSTTFPTLLRGFDEGQFEEVDINGIDSSTRKLKEIYDTKFKVPEAELTYEEVDYKGEPEMAYIVTLPNVRFILEEVNPGMELILKALIAENLFFSGGLSYGGAPSASLFPRSYRTSTKIGGKATVEYIKYAGEVVPLTQ